MSGNNNRLNPQIREVDIGVRNLRKINIYPMSMADEVQFTKLIEEVLNSYFAQLGESEESLTKDKLSSLIMSLTGVIGKNIEQLITIVTDPKEITVDDFLKGTTNTQMSEIINRIVQDNFEEPAKNLISLTNRFKGLFQLTRQSPTSLSDTLNSDLRTFSESPLEKEA